MPTLEHRQSYETIKFNTPDGEIHKGQFAFDGQVYYVREHQENNYQHILINPRDDKDYLTKIAGLVEVQIVEGEHMYFDEYILPSGRIYRVPTNSQEYRKRELPTFVANIKNVSASEIANIVKDDDKWR